MSRIVEILERELEAFNQNIRDVLESKNINTTRKASESLRIEINETDKFVHAKSLGIYYLEFLDTGRAGGKMPPINKLIQWASIKFGVGEKEATQIAWAVAKKIQAIGTVIFRNNSEGIELTEKVRKLRESLNIELKSAAVVEVTQKLDRFKKKYKFNM